MKKIVAVCALLILLLPFSGCSAAVDVKFAQMARVLTGEYERCVYSVEINDGKENGTVHTDASSEMVLVFEKTADGLAKLTMDLTVTYISTPAYVLTPVNEEPRDYKDLTDTMHSEIVFNGYTDDFNPVSVNKKADLATSKKYDTEAHNRKDKSFSAQFDYPEGKTAGKGSYTNSGDETKDFSVKSKSLKNAFDNEQIYYMASSFLRGTPDAENNAALNYSKQYKIFNLTDYCINGKGAQSVSFRVGEHPISSYCGITGTGGAEIAEVTVSFSQGQPLNMYYSLKDRITGVKTDDNSTRIRQYLLLGYEQKTVFNSTTLALTRFALKEYSLVNS